MDPACAQGRAGHHGRTSVDLISGRLCIGPGTHGIDDSPRRILLAGVGTGIEFYEDAARRFTEESRPDAVRRII